MSEPKPFASLSSGLLARKGAARPAMRPQGFGQVTAAGLDDLGWNDMGGDSPAGQHEAADHESISPAVVEHLRTAHPTGLSPIDSPVHDQQAEIADRFGANASFDDEEFDEEYDETAEVYEAEPAPQPISAPVASGKKTALPRPSDEDYAVAAAAAEAHQAELAEAQQAEVHQAEAAAEPLELDSPMMPEPVAYAPVEAEPVAVAPVEQEPAAVAPFEAESVWVEQPSPLAEKKSHPAVVAVVPEKAPHRDPKPRSEPGLKSKAAFTLRLDPSRHLKLRLACAMRGRSAQQLVTDALDQLLDGIPELESMAEKANRRG